MKKSNLRAVLALAFILLFPGFAFTLDNVRISSRPDAKDGLNTVISWSFANDRGGLITPDSDITLTYSYSGLRVTDGKLTNNVISGNETKTIDRNDREYTISHSGLITITNLAVSAVFNGERLTGRLANDPLPIELRLYNIAYEKAREYGAVEILSHARNYTSMGGLGPTTQARQNIIINHINGKPVNLYSSTFSLGHGGISGSNQATQNREWYYDGAVLYGRSNGGHASMSNGGSGPTTPLIPSTADSRWAETNSVLHVTNNRGNVTSTHMPRWTAFSNALRQNPFQYMPYDINKAFISLYGYKYTNPTTTSNNMTAGRSEAPFGLIDTAARGALAYNADGTFEFTLLLDSNAANSEVITEWIGNVEISNMGHSSITYVIDREMRFIKYHAMDVYKVDDVINAMTYTGSVYYFVYHADNIVYNNHATYRAHPTRPNHVNFVPAGVNSETIIAPYGNFDDGSMVIAGSRYAINLDWIRNCTTKVNIP